MEKESQQSSQKGEEEEEQRKITKSDVDVEDGEDNERLLHEFEEEMADMTVPSSKIEEIKEEMQKEFDNIIEEVRALLLAYRLGHTPSHEFAFTERLFSRPSRSWRMKVLRESLIALRLHKLWRIRWGNFWTILKTKTNTRVNEEQRKTQMSMKAHILRIQKREAIHLAAQTWFLKHQVNIEN